ncbi:MAG TPA: hypothetical protein VLM91_21215 [Candidatus Methylomirabilis sp.]|nr:hypothetical protein [Candidatus Methylomirabilis sp.]
MANENVFRFGPDGTDASGNLGSQAPVTVSLSGPLLNATDTTFQATNAGFLALRDHTTFTEAGSGPLISIIGTNSDLSNVSTPSGNFLTLATGPETTPPVLTLTNPTGSLLAVTNTNINAGTASANDNTFLFVADGATLASAGTGPLTTFTNSSLTSAGNFLTVRRSGTGTSLVNLSGALLSAFNSSFTTFNTVISGGCCAFLFVGEGGKLQGSGLDALLQLSNSSFPNIGGSFVNVTPTANLLDSTPAPSSITLSGPLMDDTGSTFTIAGSLLRVVDGSTFSSTTTVPLMRFSGSTMNADSLLFLRGVATDPSTGLGTQEIFKTGGSILELSSTTTTPATRTTVNLTGTGNAVRVDTALLNASAPIINLINSTLNTSATGDPTTGAIHLLQSSVTSSLPIVNVVNNSILTVQNGPLLSLTGGTQMTVTNDLISVSGGSQIKVLNGPLIFVNGGPTATKSTLTINGGLLNFASGTGNQVIINNSIPATRVDTSGNVSIPVSEIGTGSVVSVTNPTVVNNLANGSVSVTCKTGCVATNPASLIQVVGGGKVLIKPSLKP